MAASKTKTGHKNRAANDGTPQQSEHRFFRLSGIAKCYNEYLSDRGTSMLGTFQQNDFTDSRISRRLFPSGLREKQGRRARQLFSWAGEVRALSLLRWSPGPAS